MIKTKNTYDGRNSNQHMHHLLDVFAAVFWTILQTQRKLLNKTHCMSLVEKLRCLLRSFLYIFTVEEAS